ncbi:PREDICTED: uncharacterized protein LOC104728975 [Camelina sativa]|uniref:Uncharacterized protein LOC104728975 n=1 Tax=Camelina sativa TaxID=90675 RepID=A0ABM0UTN6_CAMSA|nr:PREDICTED: uncharacterized protein LOC104728975 [Camelina sativa]
MSLLLNQLSKLCFQKPVLVRSSPVLPNNGFSTSLTQTPPCSIICAEPCGADLGKLVIWNATESKYTHLEKKVPLELVDKDVTITIGSSHGWVATLEDDSSIVRLQDDLNPVASDKDPKRVFLPPLVTLPHCQTKVVTNVAMSSSSPEDEDCVVAIKFLGPQLSFCRPAQSNPEWINIAIENPCFFSSPVMFSNKDDIMLSIPGSGGHLIGSWDLHKHSKNPKLQSLRFQNLPKLTKAKRDLLDSCYASEHLVESRTTSETFLVKRYKKTVKIFKGIVKMKTEFLMVFKIDEQGNAVFTQDIGGLVIFLSKSEPFCVPASSFSGMSSNGVRVLDVDESANVSLDRYQRCIIHSTIYRDGLGAPYHIPPQKKKTNSWDLS